MAISLESLKRSSPLPPRDLIYGIQGVGKTTLAAQMPSPIFLATEDGLSGLEGVAHWEIRSYQDCIDAVSVLHGEHQFQTAVLDTVTAFEPMLHRKMLEQWSVDSLDKVGSNGGGYFKWRMEALPLWQDVLDGLDSLRLSRGMQVMLIGHSIEREVKPPEVDPFRRYGLDLLNDKACNLLYRWVDTIGFCNYRVSVTGATTDKRGKVSAGRAVGSGQRVMHLSERPAWVAKNRYGLPDEIPLSCQDYLAAFNRTEQPSKGDISNG